MNEFIEMAAEILRPLWESDTELQSAFEGSFDDFLLECWAESY